MGFCTEGVALVLAALVASGCATGHLLDRARRWERPIAYEAAAVDDGRLTVAYTAAVMDQFWRRRATCRRRAALPLAQFADPKLPADAVRFEPLADGAPLEGTPTNLVALPPPEADGRLFVPGAATTVLHPAALTRRRLAPWVYPLLPLAAAYDAVAVPVLLLFAPLVILPGDSPG